MRGSLSVGGETAPFAETVTGCCASADGAPDGNLFFNVYSPNSVVVGFGGGPGLAATPGIAAPGALVTVGGETFTIGALPAYFFTLTYVPEPSPTALLAIAAVALVSFRRLTSALARAE